MRLGNLLCVKDFCLVRKPRSSKQEILFLKRKENKHITFYIFRDQGAQQGLCLSWVPWWLSGKESGCQAGERGPITGLVGFPWRKKWQPAPVFLPGKSHGQRGLVGFSPQGRRHLHTTEWLNSSNVASSNLSFSHLTTLVLSVTFVWE